MQLVLEEKRLPYEAVLLHVDKGELRTPEHVARSPHAKVPALTDDGLSLYESTAIVEYLEERYPAPPLLPGDPAARALLRIEELECVDYTATAFHAVVRQRFFTPPDTRDPAALEQADREVRHELERLEERATRRHGDFMLGATPTRADFTWLPFIELAARAKVDLDGHAPWLLGWRERMRARPSYAASYPQHWRT